MARRGMVWYEPWQAATRSASSSGKVRFSQYQGIGNDFILVSRPLLLYPSLHARLPACGQPVVSQEQAAWLCDRHFGVGGDGVIFLLPGLAGADFTMCIFNTDGSEPDVRPVLQRGAV
ncbi:unnamed protein product [Closterium sp. Naga37s-1]|nr:unnamed protein product [Closterium sp. Naga37s-1]